MKSEDCSLAFKNRISALGNRVAAFLGRGRRQRAISERQVFARAHAGSVGGAPMTELHVIPDERTNEWRVYAAGASAPLSEHATASDAELAAQMWAERCGVDRVLVHDRYHRVYEAAATPAAVGARMRFARAREVALVRERIRQAPGPTRRRTV